MVPNRNPAACLYAPIVDQPRPQVTPPVEQGKPVVLSDLFSPPAWVGVGAWWRSPVFPIHSSLFPLTFLCGARRPRRAKPRLGPLLSVTFKDGGDGSKPVSFSLLEKERFLESKEKGAPVRVRWLQIVIRRPVFTPPLRSSTVHRRLRRWNRETPWSYPTFFRRLRGQAAGRGAAAWDCRCCGAGGQASQRGEGGLCPNA